MARILVDCDLVLAASDIAWIKWLRSIAQSNDKVYNLSHNTPIDYDLTSYYKESLQESGRDGYDFWRSTTLYDYVAPVIGAVDVISELSYLGHEIVVVSSIKGNHAKSKYQFIARHFPTVDGIIFTKEKHYIDGDYIIDDRLDNLINHPAKHKIQFETDYKQSVESNNDIIVCNGWEDISEYIKLNED